jgi:hypothetical protein
LDVADDGLNSLNILIEVCAEIRMPEHEPNGIHASSYFVDVIGVQGRAVRAIFLWRNYGIAVQGHDGPPVTRFDLAPVESCNLPAGAKQIMHRR